MHCTPQCVRPRMGTKTQHCGAGGLVSFPLWPAVPAAHLDTPPNQSPVDVAWIDVENGGNSITPKAEHVQALGFAPINSPRGLTGGRGSTSVLAMMSGVLLLGHHLQVARVVVGSVSVDVVDFLAFQRPGDEAMLVHLDVLSPRAPAESGIPIAVDVPARRAGGWYFTITKGAHWGAVDGPGALALASVAPPTLPRGIGDYGLAIDANDVHALTIQWSCHQTFSSPSIGDAHRVPESTHKVAGKQVRDSYRNRCLTTAEMTDLGWRLIDGKWTGPKSDAAYWGEGA